MSTGVLVMAYGTPRSHGEIEAYYTHIRHGRPPTGDQLDDLESRYEAIGGISPMRQRTDAQVAAIAAALGSTALGSTALGSAALGSAHGDGFVVRLGQKHAAPFIEDAVEELLGAGVTHIVGLVLAPHYSAASIGEYHRRASGRLQTDFEYSAIDDWSTEPALVDFTASALRDTLDSMPARTAVVFTAHSLPERLLEGDPYPDRLRRSAQAIVDAVEMNSTSTWQVAWQSAGRTPELWMGPDILEVIPQLAAEGAQALVVVPQGFVSDHLEILYDLDIKAAGVAADAGLGFARTRVVNADPKVMGALAQRVTKLSWRA